MGIIKLLFLRIINNSSITLMCYCTGDGDQLEKALEVLSEMNVIGLSPNSITYSILLVASEK